MAKVTTGPTLCFTPPLFPGTPSCLVWKSSNASYLYTYTSDCIVVSGTGSMAFPRLYGAFTTET